jgi:hypothetical protein
MEIGVEEIRGRGIRKANSLASHPCERPGNSVKDGELEEQRKKA